MPEILALTRAPSNIALLKYMGKKDSKLNLPENPSLSLTLDSLCSFAEVSLERSGDTLMDWIPEAPRSIPAFKQGSGSFQGDALPWLVPKLSDLGPNSGKAKVIRHLQQIRLQAPSILERHGIRSIKNSDPPVSWTLRTVNTFPAASGIASSASSFAAITMAGAVALSEDQQDFEKVWESEPQLRRDLASLSRLGSGSSCRSFEGPWVLWQEAAAAAVPAHPELEVAHFVLVLSAASKEVSSSDAHHSVRSSPLWEGRPARVEKRSQLATEALKAGDWQSLVWLAWSDSWEMHSLFHTCAEPFSYWKPETMDALQWFAGILARSPNENDVSAPIVTLDAGPNVHVIVKKSEREIWYELLKRRFPGAPVFADQPGSGASSLKWK